MTFFCNHALVNHLDIFGSNLCASSSFTRLRIHKKNLDKTLQDFPKVSYRLCRSVGELALAFLLPSRLNCSVLGALFADFSS